MRKGLFCGFLLPFILFQTAFAQLQETVDVELVEIYVSALDSDNNPITDLTAGDFIIKEDGIEQSITYFTRLLDEESQIPLTVGFLLDTSGSMGKGDEISRIDIARQFAAYLMNELKPADQMRVYAFDNVYRALTPMTSDLAAIQKNLESVNIDTVGSPGTALLASVDLTIEQLDPYFGRKIMVICSDGYNTIDGPPAEKLIEKLKKRDITVISLVTVTKREWQAIDTGVNTRYERPREEKAARKLMKDLAVETGGESLFVERVSKIQETMNNVRSVIRSQYAIAYKPKSQGKAGWHNIDVRCKRKGVKLQYRKGYFIE